MSDEFTYGQLISCTSLTDFQYNPSDRYKMSLTWDLPASSIINYYSIELYRYIGDLNECVDSNSVTDAIGEKILTRRKIGNGYTNTYYFPQEKSESIPDDTFTGVHTFIDDFSILNPSEFTIDRFHSLSQPSKYNNLSIIEDISFTRRVVYYILKTYIQSITDSAPYLVTPDYIQKTLVNHSSKTQVRHNYLHYEGDEIWNSWVADAAQDEVQKYCKRLGPVVADWRCSGGSSSPY